MNNEILITQLNDFIFCPISIYFHMLYGDMDRISTQTTYQINGTAAHETLDIGTYSTKKDILTGISVYSEKYGLIGKIDMYDSSSCILKERKRTIKTIFDGYIYQVYAQCLALREMGYEVKKIILHSITDNKSYTIPLPEEDEEMLNKFERTIAEIRQFDINSFRQTNIEKCKNCIYEPACDRGLREEQC